MKYVLLALLLTGCAGTPKPPTVFDARVERQWIFIGENTTNLTEVFDKQHGFVLIQDSPLFTKIVIGDIVKVSCSVGKCQIVEKND